MLFPILRLNGLHVVVFQPDERHGNRTASVLGWYDRHIAYNIWFKQRRKKIYEIENFCMTLKKWLYMLNFVEPAGKRSSQQPMRRGNLIRRLYLE